MQLSIIKKQGKRSNMEDNCFPDPDITEYKGDLYLVCDGVGGNKDGEVASEKVCMEFEKYNVSTNLTSNFLDWLNKGLSIVQNELVVYATNNPDSAEMSTTMALVKLDIGNQIAHIAHIGDSRVYQIRNGKILFKTKDHSYVNELVDMNIITEAEALTHPKRNVITRSITARDTEIPKADTSSVKIKNDDYFLVCSDGILETYQDADIESLFSSNLTIEEMKTTIEQNCEQNSKDNYTAIILKIEDESLSKLAIKEDTTTTNIQHSNKSNNTKLKLVSIFILGFISVILFFLFSQKGKSIKEYFRFSDNQDNQFIKKDTLTNESKIEINPTPTTSKVQPTQIRENITTKVERKINITKDSTNKVKATVDSIPQKISPAPSITNLDTLIN